MGYAKSLLCSLIVIIIICILHSSFPPPSDNSITNITLLRDAHFLQEGRIGLTSYSSSSVGRALYKYPIMFRNISTKSSASFTSKFTFTIIPNSIPSPPLFGDGLTFLITSNPKILGNGFGFMGLSNRSNQEEYFAIEFDTSFDPSLEDISDNHIGVHINSIISYPTVDLTPMGFDLKNTTRITAWVDYINSEKRLEVWLSYNDSRPIRPLLTTYMDFSAYINELMYVGFSASNGKGGCSSKHIVDKWIFETYPSPFDSSISFHSTEEGSDLANGAGPTLWLLLGTLIFTAIIRKIFFSPDQIVGDDQTISISFTDAPRNPEKTVDGKNIKARRDVVNQKPRLTEGTIKEALRSLQLEEIIEELKSKIKKQKDNLILPVCDEAKDHYRGIIAYLTEERDSQVSEKKELDKKVIIAGLQRKSKAELEDMLLQVKTKA
ncbi:L-type lectin-domain containing receptor kinase S.6-like [Papaver somniferum]|uniref:L-type lectin-domain containing receptor kinase S.6-like n=1 Tax=Papaver somniferum TaxID=3469 RepID=UPI000E7043F4|nr:L-type lectin-domain containing receptor kinase S.6-like [Papaver somniferum]